MKVTKLGAAALAIGICGLTHAALAEDQPLFTVTTNEETKVVTVRRTRSDVSGVFNQSFPDGSIVRKLELHKNGSSECNFSPTEASALPDGIQLFDGQWRFASTQSMGAGPLVVGEPAGGSQLAFVIAGTYDVLNEVRMAHSNSQVVATDNAHVTLHNLSVSDADIAPWLGRAANKTMITLALDGETNSYLKGIHLSGKGSPFELDGGTIRMAAGAQSPFFTHVGTDADWAASTFAVSKKPLTVDAQADADAKFGLPLVLDGVEEEIAVLPANNSFEDGETGWTWAKADSSAGNKAGVQANGSTWVSSSCRTSYGDKYYTLRCLHKLTSSGSVTLTAATDWYVEFWDALRSQTDYNSQRIDVTVRLINAETAETYTVVRPGQTDYYYTFKHQKVGPFDVPAGNYKIEFETSWPGTEYDANKWSGVSIDNVRLVRTRRVAQTIVKTGAGRVAVDGVTARGTSFTVEDGSFALQDSVADGVKVDVKGGATYEFGLGLTRGADGMTVDVAVGGTLALRETDGNLIKNASFESPAQTDYARGDPTDWAYAKVTTIAQQENGCGLQKNGKTMSSKGPYTSFGEQTAYIRNGYRLTQQVNVAVAGRYRFSFVRSYRSGFYTPGTDDFHLTASVSASGDEHAFDVPLTASYEPFVQEIELEAGVHEVRFETSGSADTNGIMAFVDGVELTRICVIGDVQDVAVSLRSGSKVRLDNVKDVHIQNVTVDGRRVDGGVGSLRAAGVTVEGDGKLRVGDKTGLLVIVK